MEESRVKFKASFTRIDSFNKYILPSFQREMYKWGIIIFHLSKVMKSQFLNTVWCNISGEAAGAIWSWSLLGVKGLTCVLPMVGWRKISDIKSRNGKYRIFWMRALPRISGLPRLGPLSPLLPSLCAIFEISLPSIKRPPPPPPRNSFQNNEKYSSRDQITFLH